MILVDSDILITLLRGRDVARDWMLSAIEGPEPLAVSAVSVTEITGGMRSGERREVTRLLNSLLLLPVDRPVAWQAGEYQRRFRRSHHAIGIADYLVAATARVHGCELATLNIKHFPMFDGLAAPFALPAP